MGTLKDNLKLSKEACDYALNIVGVKGANWDQYSGKASYESCRAGGGTEASCKPLKDSVDICLYDKVRPTSRARRRSLKKPTMIKQLQIIADEVKLNKCGNCGEFAILAFMYLFKKKVVPIDWVSLKGADHAFVIIGRDSGDPSKVAKWGPNAVICDPWARGFRGNHVDSGTYPGTDFSLKMRNLIGSFSGINSLHRED